MKTILVRAGRPVSKTQTNQASPQPEPRETDGSKLSHVAIPVPNFGLSFLFSLPWVWKHVPDNLLSSYLRQKPKSK